MLSDELLNDPLSRGYSSMSDEDAAADLNTVYRERDRETMSASAVYQAIDRTEFQALTVAQQQEIYSILSFGEVNPFGKEADVFVEIFGAGSTITALQAARKEPISRANELKLGIVKPGHVGEARG